MTRIVLASHGRLADGMKDTLSFILGDLPNVSTICAYVDQDVSLRSQIDQAFAEFSPEDVVVVVTDLFGGSVNNEFTNVVQQRENIHLVTNMNLPLLISLLFSINEPDLAAAIRAAVSTDEVRPKYCNDELAALNADDEDF